jgi:hypothetical protein
MESLFKVLSCSAARSSGSEPGRSPACRPLDHRQHTPGETSRRPRAYQWIARECVAAGAATMTFMSQAHLDDGLDGGTATVMQ